MKRFDRQSIIVAAASANVRLASLTNDSTHWDRAIELAAEITRRDPHGIASWRNLGDMLWAAGRRIDALVSNDAFPALRAPIAEARLEDYRTALETMAVTPFRLIQLVAPAMRKQPSAS